MGWFHPLQSNLQAMPPITPLYSIPSIYGIYTILYTQYTVYYVHKRKGKPMPQKTVYIRKEDLPAWMAIENKTQFIHDALNNSHPPHAPLDIPPPREPDDVEPGDVKQEPIQTKEIPAKPGTNTLSVPNPEYQSTLTASRPMTAWQKKQYNKELLAEKRRQREKERLSRFEDAGVTYEPVD